MHIDQGCFAFQNTHPVVICSLKSRESGFPLAGHTKLAVMVELDWPKELGKVIVDSWNLQVLSNMLEQ